MEEEQPSEGEEEEEYEEDEMVEEENFEEDARAGSMASSWQILMELKELAHRLGSFERLQLQSVQAAGMNPLLCHDGPPVRFQDLCAAIHCLQPSQ